MTEDDKALVERLREEAADWDEPKHPDEVDVRGMLHNAADRIEALTAEVERLNRALQEVVISAAEWASKAGAAEGKLKISETAGILDGWKRENQELRSEIARLREVGDRLAMFSTHDIDCDCYVGHKVLPCNCGYTAAINAWKELQP